MEIKILNPEDAKQTGKVEGKPYTVATVRIKFTTVEEREAFLAGKELKVCPIEL